LDDDPVIRHIPEFELVGEADMTDVKMRHILSHTTGLPPMERREGIVSFDSHVEYLATADYQLLGRPGEYFSYSNDTFLLNGLIIERKTGQIYRRYMTGHTLDAIGMNRTTYNLGELEKMGNVSTPYIYDAKAGQYTKPAWPTLGTYEVGGGVRSCVLDLAKYGQVYLNGGVAANGNRIVSEQGLLRMREPMHEVANGTHYCLALKKTPGYAGRDITLIEHSGGQPGVSSNFGFVPERGITVAVLTNLSAAPSSSIWLAAVNTALGLPLDTKRSIETEWAAPAGYLDRFVGVYESAESGSIDIAKGPQGGLMLHSEAGDFPLSISSERTLFCVVAGEQQVLRFYFDPARDAVRPWAVLSGSRMHRRA
jgi:CubicO group peptidase (beta-lactamase class C family)